ncbi:hypothetical protein [Pontibacter chitinilyticus]|uniref:hypothetical protein n=1 Tax=Pontibacter chitinilyticus TaxID=2674989 RepID=UPI003218EDBF
MEADKDKKAWEKTAQDAAGDLKTGRIPDKHTDAQYRELRDENRNDPNPVKGEPEGKDQQQDKKDQSKQNGPDKPHSAPGNAAGTKEDGAAPSTDKTTVRAATTDSSRMPKNSNDEGPTGGNVR